MREEQVTALRNLLTSVVPKGKLAPKEIDALVSYMAEVTKTEEEAIKRLSGILQSDLNGVASWQTILQVEQLRDRSADHLERLRFLEHHLVQLEHFRDKSGDYQERLRSLETKILQLEHFRDKSADYEERLRSLEHPKSSDDVKWTVVKAIFTTISFIASTIALLKAFDLLQLPWLK